MSNQSKDLLKTIIEEVRSCPEITFDVYQHVTDYLSSSDLPSDENEQIFENLANEETDINKKIFFYSVSFSVNKSIDKLESLVDYVWNNRSEIEPSSMSFLHWQFIYKLFIYPELKSNELQSKIWKLLQYNISRYESLCSDLLEPIPACERNKDFILVITDQFIAYQHGPTKTAADRCKILMESLHKRVLLLNTAEVMSPHGMVPFFDTVLGNYSEGMLNQEFVEWKGCKIPYFQCERVMPDLDIIRAIISMVRKQRPLYTVVIGTGGILSSLVAKIIPSISIGLAPSGIGVSEIPFQTLSRPLNDSDRSLLNMVGKTENSIVVGTFGSSILEQTAWLNREEVGLPSDTWLGVLVGGRLNQELTSDFWNMAEEASRYGLEYVILGTYSQTNLENVESNHPSLKGKIHNIGFVSDILSYMDLCDLYINPIRAGGGTSSVEALSMGIPVITTSFGDVAVNVGEQFQTDSYESMVNLIERYISDFDFYKNQSQAAKKRSEILLNAEESFIKILTDFSNRIDLAE